MVPQATQTTATIGRLARGRKHQLAAKAANRASAKAAYAAKRAQQQADAPPPKEVAAEAARKLLLRRQTVARYRAARRAKLRTNATFDMPAVLPFLTAACLVGLCSMSAPLPAAPQPAPLHIYEPRLPATAPVAGITATVTAPPPTTPRSPPAVFSSLRVVPSGPAPPRDRGSRWWNPLTHKTAKLDRRKHGVVSKAHAQAGLFHGNLLSGRPTRRQPHAR